MYTLNEIRKIDTQKLLMHYRKVRKSKYHYICECCHEFIWDIGHGDENDKKEYYKILNYLTVLKKELGTREHIPNKKERKKIRQKKANRRT